MIDHKEPTLAFLHYQINFSHPNHHFPSRASHNILSFSLRPPQNTTPANSLSNFSTTPEYQKSLQITPILIKNINFIKTNHPFSSIHHFFSLILFKSNNALNDTSISEIKFIERERERDPPPKNGDEIALRSDERDIRRLPDRLLLLLADRQHDRKRHVDEGSISQPHGIEMQALQVLVFPHKPTQRARPPLAYHVHPFQIDPSDPHRRQRRRLRPFRSPFRLRHHQIHQRSAVRLDQRALNDRNTLRRRRRRRRHWSRRRRGKRARES